MNKITPILLAGGSGTRLWPLSRKKYPKQFSKIIDELSLFQLGVMRCQTSSILEFNQPIILASDEHRFIIEAQFREVVNENCTVLLEPVGKNTAPAILAACLFALNSGHDPLMLAIPSDHIIEPNEIFHAAVSEGVKFALDGRIVTFGIPALTPETGYGYLQVESLSAKSPFENIKFVEKPSLSDAKKLIQNEKCFWNSGVFLFQASTLKRLFEEKMPQLVQNVSEALAGAQYDLSFLKLDAVPWDKCSDISIDFAVMEKAGDLVCIPLNSHWSDLGDWNSVWKEMAPDDAGVSVAGNALSIDCENTLLRSENNSLQLVGIGLRNVIGIAMGDAVLIADKNRSQDVKEAVHKLKLLEIEQAELFPKDYRPWGWFESLTKTDRFQVKKLYVKPSAQLSLQLHNHRSEHWVVVEGTAEVTIGDETKLITEGESIYIPLGTKHRLKNPGKIQLIIIEVQTGAYLGEDDIVRYSDIYDRL